MISSIYGVSGPALCIFGISEICYGTYQRLFPDPEVLDEKKQAENREFAIISILEGTTLTVSGVAFLALRPYFE